MDSTNNNTNTNNNIIQPTNATNSFISLTNFFHQHVGLDIETSTQYEVLLDDKITKLNQLLSHETLKLHGIDNKLHQTLIVRVVQEYLQQSNSSPFILTSSMTVPTITTTTTTTTTSTAKKVSPRCDFFNIQPKTIYTAKKDCKRICVLEKREIIVGGGDHAVQVFTLDGKQLFDKRNVHSGVITRIISTRDENYVVTCDDRSLLVIWHVENDKEENLILQIVHLINIKQNIWSIIFTQDEKYILCGCSGGYLYQVDFTQGVVIRAESVQPYAILNLALHPANSDLILIGKGVIGDKLDYGMGLCRISDFTLIHRFYGHSSYVRCVYWINDDQCMSAGADGKILVFSLESKVKLREMNTGCNIWSLTMTKEKDLIVVGTEKQSVIFIDFWNWEQLYTISFSGSSGLGTMHGATTNVINSVCFSPSQQQLYVGFTDGTFKILSSLDITSEDELQQITSSQSQETESELVSTFIQ
jgi:WD40 repeat protein